MTLRRAWIYSAACALAAGCAVPPLVFGPDECDRTPVDAGPGGSGGAGPDAGVSETGEPLPDAEVPPEDAGPAVDADAGVPCPTCFGFLYGEKHVVAPLCPLSEGTSAIFAFVSCGCAPGGSCTSQCTGGAWCGGVYPALSSWSEPDAACGACLSAMGPAGCGDEAWTCMLH